MSLNTPAPSKRTWEKMKESPLVPIGFLGFLVVGIYGIRNYRNQRHRDKTAYFGALRVMAQGMVVGTLGCAAIYDSVKYFFISPEEKKSDS